MHCRENLLSRLPHPHNTTNRPISKHIHHHHHPTLPYPILSHPIPPHHDVAPKAYHPLCARMAGLHMEHREAKEPGGPLQLVTFCYRHCTPRPEKAGERGCQGEGL